MGSGRKSPRGDTITPMPRCVVRIVFAAFSGASDISHCQGGDKGLKGHSSCPVRHLLCSQWLLFLPSIMPFVYWLVSLLVFFQAAIVSFCISEQGWAHSGHYCHINAGHLLDAPPSDATLLPHTAAPRGSQAPQLPADLCKPSYIPTAYLSPTSVNIYSSFLPTTHNIFFPEFIP